MTPTNRTAARALRVGGSVVLLGAVILVLPRGELVAALRQASLAVLVPAVLVFVLCHVAAAFKWRLLMGQATDVSWSKAVRAHFSGLVGNLSPLGMIGGDIVRAGVAIKGSSQSNAILLTSVLDRIVDTAALLILALTSLAWIGGRSSGAGVVLWGGGLISVAGLCGLAVARWVLTRAQHRHVAGLRRAFDLLLSNPWGVGRALLYSVMIQGTLVVANAHIGASVGVQSSLAAWLFAWPAAKFAGYLPIGLGGIGVRETALVALLRPLGGAPGPVLASALLWHAVVVTGSLLGWLAVWIGRTAVLPVVRRVLST